jgi:hypothetical protein
MSNGWVLGVDPGYTTGISVVDITTGRELRWWHVKFDDILIWFLTNDCLDLGVDEIFMEDFTLLQHKALQQSGSRLETVQVIGMVKMWAVNTNTPIHMQLPTIKALAEKWTGVVPKGSHDKSHHIDAYNHACYGLRKQGRFVTVLERETSNDRSDRDE